MRAPSLLVTAPSMGQKDIRKVDMLLKSINKTIMNRQYKIFNLHTPSCKL